MYQFLRRYNKLTMIPDVIMAEAVGEGEPIAIVTITGYGRRGVRALAHSTRTVLSVASLDCRKVAGYATRTLTAADVTAGGDAAKMSLATETQVDTNGWTINGQTPGTSLTPGNRVFLDQTTPGNIIVSDTAPSTAANRIVILGQVIAADRLLLKSAEPLAAVQAAGNSTVAVA